MVMSCVTKAEEMFQVKGDRRACQLNTGQGKRRVTIVRMENNTIINK